MLHKCKGRERSRDSHDPFVQVDNVPVAEDEIEVFESFCEPEALHAISLPKWSLTDINNGCMSNVCSRSLFDILEHAPGHVSQLYVASDAV